MKYLLAIDAGTGSIRALLFDTEGNQISIAQREWHHLEEPGVPNSMGFDFATNWELTKACIREAVEKAAVDPEDILALSATSMREGIVLYDHEGNELWGVANVDARLSTLEKRLGKTPWVAYTDEKLDELSTDLGNRINTATVFGVLGMVLGAAGVGLGVYLFLQSSQ